MFCPFCGKQNKDNVPFCAFCGKALPQKSPTTPVTQSITNSNQSPQESSPKRGLSYNAKRGIVTGLLIAIVVIVIVVIYYPQVLPWNW